MPVIRSYARTDVGRKRKHSEDAFLADDALGLYVVADGMGGHAAGDVASAQAVKSMREAVAGEKPLLEAFGRSPSVESRELVSQLLERAISKACADIHAIAARDEGKRGMGTTVVALLAAGKKAVVGHVEAGADEETTDVEGKTEILRRIPLFQHMTYKELLAILGVARGRQFEKGQGIIREGEQGDELFVLFRGTVEVTKSGVRIARLESGGHFGEMGLVDQGPRSATVVAAEETSAISLDRDSLLKLMRRDPLLAVKLLWSFVQVLSERLRNANEALTDLKLDKAPGPFGQ